MNVLTVGVQVVAAAAFASGVRSLAALQRGPQFRCPPGIWMGPTLWVAGSLLATPTTAWLGLVAVVVSLVTLFIWTVAQLSDGRPSSGSPPGQVERRAGYDSNNTGNERLQLPGHEIPAAASVELTRSLAADTPDGQVPAGPVVPHGSSAGMR